MLVLRLLGPLGVRSRGLGFRGLNALTVSGDFD